MNKTKPSVLSGSTFSSDVFSEFYLSGSSCFISNLIFLLKTQNLLTYFWIFLKLFRFLLSSDVSHRLNKKHLTCIIIRTAYTCSFKSTYKYIYLNVYKYAYKYICEYLATYVIIIWQGFWTLCFYMMHMFAILLANRFSEIYWRMCNK